jgi:putative nucleotidyltransferase with HDIG domain
MMTGVHDLPVGIEAMKEGCDDYLVKPFEMEEAVRRLQRALEKKFLERRIESYRVGLEGMVDQRTSELRKAMKHIESTYDETLGALGAALDLRDNETAGHSCRVMRYSVAMARQMGCSDEQITNIARGAYLHDIGKIGVPDAILRKPAKLTDEETAIMRTHVRIGYELVCRIAFLKDAAAIVLTHHERYDGTGYPQGLVGKEIPLGSRIFAVADTLDAMTSDRPYRHALPYSTAHDEIVRGSGKQFDPEVVQAFVRITETEFAQIRHAQDVRRGSRSTGPSSDQLAFDEVVPLVSGTGSPERLLVTQAR